MKLKILTLALALPLSALGDTNFLQDNELFLEVWNGNTDSTGLSYIKDLGITLDAFLTAAACFNGDIDLSGDANLTLLKTSGVLSDNAVWSVQAVNDDNFSSLQDPNGANNDPQSPKNHTGYLSTVTNPLDITDINNLAYGAATAAMKTHLNNAGVGLKGSKAFTAADRGYYQEPGIWNELMNGQVGFSSSQKIGDGGTLGMYLMTADLNQSPVVGHNGQALGEWSFNGSRLRFTAASDQPNSPCPSDAPPPAPEPTPTPPPTSSTSTSAGAMNLRMLLPKSGDTLQAGIRQPIGWLSGDIAPSNRLNLFYSNNGGLNWKRIKSGLRVNGYYLWKPGRKQISEKAMLAVCVPQSKTALPECAATEGTFKIRKQGERIPGG